MAPTAGGEGARSPSPWGRRGCPGGAGAASTRGARPGARLARARSRCRSSQPRRGLGLPAGDAEPGGEPPAVAAAAGAGGGPAGAAAPGAGPSALTTASPAPAGAGPARWDLSARGGRLQRGPGRGDGWSPPRALSRLPRRAPLPAVLPQWGRRLVSPRGGGARGAGAGGAAEPGPSSRPEREKRRGSGSGPGRRHGGGGGRGKDRTALRSPARARSDRRGLSAVRGGSAQVPGSAGGRGGGGGWSEVGREDAGVGGG